MPVSIRVTVHPSRRAAEQTLVEEIVALLHSSPRLVLGLATGNSPIGVYQGLVERHRRGAADFSAAQTFELDEYVGLETSDPRSFRATLEREFLRQVNVGAGHAHFLEGRLDASACADHARRYENQLRAAGGLDLVLLGIGRNGHIAFNEPGAGRDTRTRRVELHPWTRDDASAAFGGLATTPTHALTMGVGTILEARRIRVLAFGEHKRDLVVRTLESPGSADWPASWLHGHPDVELVVDAAAAP